MRRFCLLSALPLFTGLLLSSLLTAPAAAQIPRYDYTCTSGGVATSQKTGMLLSTVPYTYGGNNCSGGIKDSVGVMGDTGSVVLDCSGPITVNVKWNPDGTTKPPPPAMVIQQICTASFSLTNQPGDTIAGSCNNGLGITSPGGVNSFTASSSKYTVASGATFSDSSCNPSAHVSGSNTGTKPPVPVCGGSVGVRYTAWVFPITIDLTGTKVDNSGNDNILVGQGCGATLNGLPSVPGATITYAWSISGTTFQSWSPTTPALGNVPANPKASFYVGGSGPLTNISAHWYWNDPIINPTPETVKCTATVTPPVGQGNAFTVTATKTVIVQVPAWTASGTGGYMQINTHHPTVSGLNFYAGPSPGQVGGMNWQATSTTPVLFGTGASLELVQTVTPYASYLNSTTGITHNDLENGLKGLDTQYPVSVNLPPSTYVEGGPPYQTYDAPVLSLAYFVESIVMRHAFIDYLMYQPPGADSKWIALAQFSWSTNGSATLPGTHTWVGYTAPNVTFPP